MHNSYIKPKYTPGPGQYNFKNPNHSFDLNIVNTTNDKDSYYVVRSGVMQRKTQWLAADKTKRNILLEPKTDNNSPGPGSYSPRDTKQLSQIQSSK
jgi:hypothetical protein